MIDSTVIDDLPINFLININANDQAIARPSGISIGGILSLCPIPEPQT